MVHRIFLNRKLFKQWKYKRIIQSLESQKNINFKQTFLPFLSGLVHLFTRRTESLANCLRGSTNWTIWSIFVSNLVANDLFQLLNKWNVTWIVEVSLLNCCIHVTWKSYQPRFFVFWQNHFKNRQNLSGTDWKRIE